MDKDLEQKLSLLKEIKPREEWVASMRSKLFEEEKAPRLSPFAIFGLVRSYLEKPAFVIPTLAALVFGGAVYTAAQDSLPGDALYGLRAASEQLRFRLPSQEGDVLEIRLAATRLEDLRHIAEANKVENLSPTIREFTEKMDQASQEVSRLAKDEPKRALQLSQKLVELDNGKKVVEQILGTQIGEPQEQDFHKTIRTLLENEVADLEQRSLTADQAAVLEEIKGAMEAEDYETALTLLFEIGQKQ